MQYEIISKICMSADDRAVVLKTIVGLQRNAVAAGVLPANVTLLRVTESPDKPATDITSEAIAALTPPPAPAPAPPWKVGDPDRRKATGPRRVTVGVSPTGTERRVGAKDRRVV